MSDLKSLVLKPLSDSTRTAFAPPELGPNDHLIISLDKEGTRFVCDLRAMARNEAGELVEQRWPGPSFAAGSFFERVPERVWHGTKGRSEEAQNRWTCAGTDFTALLIHHCWPFDRIHFKGNEHWKAQDGVNLYEFLLKRFCLQNARAEMVAAFKLTGVAPEPPAGWVDHPERPLADYQRVGVQAGLNQEALGLLMDRGTGKTAVGIARACLEATQRAADPVHKGGMYRALVVCPPQVRANWQREVHRFATVPGKVVVVRGSAVDRVKSLIEGVESEDDCAFSFVIVGYDSLVPSIEAFEKVRWDIIIADESHKFKWHGTKRWEAMMRLQGRQRLILTGTPIGNSPMDLWSQLEFLGKGMSGFMSFKHFREFHGVWEDQGGQHSGVSKLLAVKNVPLLQERLARLTYAVTKDEAGLKLPDKVFDVSEVEMTPAQADTYARVANQLSIELEDAMSGSVDRMTVEHILTKLLRLSQVTSNIMTWDPVCDPDSGEQLRARRVEPISQLSPKIEAFIDDVEELDPDEKAIAWCVHVPEIKALSARLTARGVQHVTYYGGTKQKDRDPSEQAFNGDPAVRVFVGNPMTAAEGLNLIGYDWWEAEPKQVTSVTLMGFLSQNWSSILREQAVDRAHRRGTRRPLTVRDYIIVGTIDEDIRDRVQKKITMAQLVTNVREILASVLGQRGGSRVA